MHRTPLAAAALLALAACGGGDADAPRPVSRGDTMSAVHATPPRTPAWTTNPAEGVRLGPGGVMTVETGPHTLLWPEGPPLEPPYTLRATLLKRQGRIHEGYGLFFGGSGVEGPEEGQSYTYFLVRGDGSYLVKRREGAATPVVRDWTRHPRINRDAGGATGANQLEVEVRADTTIFRVNGAEVERLATEALGAVAGRAGLRIAHDVVVEVQGFFLDAPGAP